MLIKGKEGYENFPQLFLFPLIGISSLWADPKSDHENSFLMFFNFISIFILGAVVAGSASLPCNGCVVWNVDLQLNTLGVFHD